MTELDALIERMEANLRVSGTVDEEVCRAIMALGEEQGVLPGGVLAFLGCRDASPPGSESRQATAAHRLLIAKLMLLRLRAHTAAPAWSSLVLEQLLSIATSIPGGQVGDIILAMYQILGEQGSTLSETAANLIRDVVVNAFTRHRLSYDASDLSRLNEDLADAGHYLTPAQAYLALHALPESAIMSRRDRILSFLKDTAYE